MLCLLSECSVNTSELLFSYIIARKGYFLIRWWRYMFCSNPTRCFRFL